MQRFTPGGEDHVINPVILDSISVQRFTATNIDSMSLGLTQQVAELESAGPPPAT